LYLLGKFHSTQDNQDDCFCVTCYFPAAACPALTRAESTGWFNFYFYAFAGQRFRIVWRDRCDEFSALGQGIADEAKSRMKTETLKKQARFPSIVKGSTAELQTQINDQNGGRVHTKVPKYQGDWNE
jgi:hypothetical protein